MTADFNKPVTTDNYVDLLAMLRDNQEALARMFSGVNAQNIPNGAVRFNAGKFQVWDGSQWNDAPLSLDGGGTGAQSAAAARVALGADDAANITKGTLSRNTTGNAATATFATSAGSAETAINADFATSAGSATSATIATNATNANFATSAGVSNENRASISSLSNTGSVTNVHTRQVNASESSTASGNRSQVNASENSTVSATWSQVNASFTVTASGQASQVNASLGATATGTASQVNASENSTVSGNRSQVNASLRVINSTFHSSAWGHALSGAASTANQQIRLESLTGVGRFKGNTTTGGFDYAEYFPNLNKGVIPDGTIVTLVDEKIRPAKEGDFVLGIVSATAGVIGNSQEFCWAGRFLRDEFGRELKQEADFVRWSDESDFYDGLVSECNKTIPASAEYYSQEIPIENPDYVDINDQYKPRGERCDEWSVIGLMGQVYVRVTEDIEHNSYVSAGGAQSDTETRLYCMKMTTPYDEQKGYGVAFCLLR